MRALYPVIFLLVGCPEATTDEGPHCEETATALGLDEANALGFTAAEVLAGVPSEQASELHYVDGSATPLALTFAPAAEARFVDSEAVYPDSGGAMPAIDLMCEDYIAVDATFTFTTDDGAFAETFASTITATSSVTGIREELDLAALAGTFALEPFVEAEDWTELAARIEVTFSGGVSSGVVSGQASGEEPCDEGDDCLAWAELVDVAVWPSAE